MGAELDSLADAVSFGVAPALVLYIWCAARATACWVVSLVFAVCMALRLARFNTLFEDTEDPPFAKEFFVGVPAPAAALLARLAAVRDAATSARLVVLARAGRAVGDGGRGADGQPAADVVAQDSPGAGRGWIAPLLVAGRAGRGRADHRTR